MLCTASRMRWRGSSAAPRCRTGRRHHLGCSRVQGRLTRPFDDQWVRVGRLLGLRSQPMLGLMTTLCPFLTYRRSFPRGSRTLRRALRNRCLSHGHDGWAASAARTSGTTRRTGRKCSQSRDHAVTCLRNSRRYMAVSCRGSMHGLGLYVTGRAGLVKEIRPRSEEPAFEVKGARVPGFLALPRVGWL